MNEARGDEKNDKISIKVYQQKDVNQINKFSWFQRRIMLNIPFLGSMKVRIYLLMCDFLFDLKIVESAEIYSQNHFSIKFVASNTCDFSLHFYIFGIPFIVSFNLNISQACESSLTHNCIELLNQRLH